MTIAIDFDGTIVEHKYPGIGKEIPFAIETLKRLQTDKHKLILWTVREGKLLDEAVEFCRKRGLEFYAINKDYPEEEKNKNNHFSRKLKADIFIDDRNLGGIPDWGTIYKMITYKLNYENLVDYNNEDEYKQKRIHFFKTFLDKIVMIKKYFAITLIATGLLSSCTSYKNVPYMQDINTVNNYGKIIPMYDAKIMPKDLLGITVNTTDPQAAAPFNLTVQTPMNAALANISTTTQPALQQYLVNNDGEIDFPVLGRLKVGGLTKNEAEDLIREKLQPYLHEKPIVTVRMSNYKISVLGEVARPGLFTVNNEKVNVLEALAMAGDMTVYGLRTNVKLIREEANGKRKIFVLDLTKSDIVLSPYFYLKQNDILYVTPNSTKAKNSDIGTTTTTWISATSIMVSIAALVINILK